MATQIAAMNVTHGQVQDAEVSGLNRKLNDAVLEMERARMVAEDARAQVNEKKQRIVTNVIDPVVHIINNQRPYISGASGHSAMVGGRLLAGCWAVGG